MGEVMFEHSVFDRYDWRKVPLHRDVHLMDVRWAREWEVEWIKTARAEEADPYTVGYVTNISVNRVADNGLEISFYANTHDRFHELKTFLPEDRIRTCLDIFGYDCRPTMFVDGDWLERLHLRSNSVFALIDAAYMTNMIETGRLSREKLIDLREAIDALAMRTPDVSFISFADSLLLKSNWTVGMVGKTAAYTYSPEGMLLLYREIRDIYRRVLDLDVYGVFAQGSNEYYDDPLLHIGGSNNHIALNSLGLPFAQLQQIEAAARAAIRKREHGRYELYLDGDLFNSLRFKDHNDRATPQFAAYKPKMSAVPGTYFYYECDDLLSRLEPAS
jgi:hypothetical protein